MILHKSKNIATMPIKTTPPFFIKWSQGEMRILKPITSSI
jgi:hypothetical protein